MKDFSDDITELRRRLAGAATYLRVDERRARLSELEVTVGEPGLWDDADRARAVTGEYSRVRDDVETYDALVAEVDDAEVLAQMAREEGDESQEPEIAAALAGVSRSVDELDLRSLFTGEHDEGDAVCEVHSGAGGTDAQDWAEMLVRMYSRWAERHGYEVEIDEWQEGEEAGITTATFIVKGRYAFGLLRAERGVHRLVRISPFDNNARRQTAFASFGAVPLLEDGSAEVEIDEKDLRVDTYRSSGAGGQHVNKTDSAVRLTHLPTGIVVACQNERSQHQNRARAMQILEARLAERQRQERTAQLSELAGAQTEVGWGNQIRSYVLAPYQMVKDLRTDYETGNIAAVLDGDLDAFMQAELQRERSERVA